MMDRVSQIARAWENRQHVFPSVEPHVTDKGIRCWCVPDVLAVYDDDEELTGYIIEHHRQQ